MCGIRESGFLREPGSHGAGTSGLELISNGISENMSLQAGHMAPGIVVQIVETVWSPIICYVDGGVMLEDGQSPQVGPQCDLSHLEEPGKTAEEEAGWSALDRPPLWESSWFLFDTMTQWLFCRSEGFQQSTGETSHEPGTRCRAFFSRHRPQSRLSASSAGRGGPYWMAHR